MKNKIPKVALLHDLSSVGRCSLGEAIPVLSCLGLQTCAIPTAVLSTQTGGFGAYHFVDLTDELPAMFAHFERLSVRFDGIYSGFLGSPRQMDLVSGLIKSQAEVSPLVLIDPVMGDDGELYSVYDMQMVERMRDFIKMADVITPNLTEAALLLERPMPSQPLMEAELLAWTQDLCRMGPQISVITGAGGTAEENCIAAYDQKAGRYYRIPFRQLPCAYPGTGDLFASVLMGLLMNHIPLEKALEFSADFMIRCIEDTQRLGAPVREGVVFERSLGKLCDLCGGWTADEGE